MNITIIDERCDELLTLGFVTASDGENHLHASIDIYEDHIYFGDFLSGNVGKYDFQANRYCFDRREHNGKLFQGAGRGRKPDKAFEEMREFIYKVDMAIRDLKLIDEYKVEAKHDKQYSYEV